ncbi:MAG: outer membrane protein OmpA/MotB family [Acidobacteriales bacterium]|nr:outer membrane protein OmpA/MotB family [Terriglobales bacterium]
MKVNAVKRQSYLLLSTLAMLIVLIAGCKKQPAPTPVAPPPPPPAPTASISANPMSVDPGGTSQLTWRTENATDVTIEGVGKVQPNGSKEVNPTESMSYHLVAKGPGGTQDATARVTVNAPPPPPVAQPTVTLSDEQWFQQNVKDIYFDYDSFTLRPDAQQTITANARALMQKPGFRVQVQGHCDERGSTEYNLTLGDERATAVKNALVAAGVPANRIDTRTFGKEQPVCTESTEACWQQNRRGHFLLNK